MSGVPNAIKVAKELEEKGKKLVGIRLDSGDLAYLSKKARKMLDDAGLDYVSIFVSNQLNEHVIKSLNEQGARIDGYGVGTELVIGKDTGAIDGVYKLVENNGIPRLKISENVEKITMPGTKRLVRYFDKKDRFYRDGILLSDEKSVDKLYHPIHAHKNTEVSELRTEELSQLVMDNGKILIDYETPLQINKYLQKRFAQLPIEHKRFISPHIYKVGISEKLMNLRNDMMESIRKKYTEQ